MRKCLFLLLCLAFFMVVALPTMADTWTPWYIISETSTPPTTPPGTPGWTEWTGQHGILFAPGNYLFVGTQNLFKEEYTKTGNIEIAWPTNPGFTGIYATIFTIGGQPDGQPRPASWDNPSLTYITPYTAAVLSGAWLNFYPQPGWEWVMFENTTSNFNFSVSAMSIYTECVPLPGTLPLLGSGLLGLWGWRRLRES